MKIKSIRLTAIAVALAIICSFVTIASANSTASIFGENYSLSTFDSIFGSNTRANSNLNNSFRTKNNAVNSMLPTNGKIVFVSNRDGNREIYTMDADGTNQTNVSNDPADDYEPSFSPDGSQIVFTSTRDGNDAIYVMNVDGTNPTRKTTNSLGDSNPSFSPDGSKILFISLRDGNAEIYLMNADGTNPTRKTTSSESEFTTSFSPDGNKILFARLLNGNAEIYLMNADGTNNQNLSNNAAHDSYPLFSPDGSQIVFVSNRDVFDQIYLMNADGTNQTNLINDTEWEGFQAVSPDGSKIAFQTTRDTSTEIYIMNSNGSNPTRLTFEASNLQPSFSPDGNRIVFASNRDGGGNKFDIFTMDLNGGNVTQLTDDEEYDDQPAFSHDGTKIVFVKRVISSYSEIYTIDSNGGNPNRLTTNETDDADPSFSPDDSRILFTSNRNYYADIFTMNTADGLNVSQLTDSPYPDFQPTYSPDGTQIAFASKRDGGYYAQIYKMNANGSNQTRVTNTIAMDTYPRWGVANDDAPPCTFSLNPTSANVPVGGANGAIAVTASDSSCEWTASSNDAWVSINSGASGTGNGIVNYAVANNTGAARTGTLTIGGQTFTVNQATGQIGVFIPTGLTAISNTTATIPVNISDDTTGRGIISYDFTVTYDSNVLTPLNPAYDKSGTMSSGMTVTINSATAGTLRISGYGTTPLSGSGTMLNLKFNAVGNAPACSTLNFAAFQFNDGNPDDSTSNGEVCILNSAVSGTVTYTNAPQTTAVRNVTLTAVGGSTFSTTSAADGSYSLNNFMSGAYTVTPTKTGEVNDAVSALDASITARYAVGLQTLTNSQQLAADVSNNGGVNSYDAALIAQFASSIANPGSAGTWKFTPVSRSYNNLTANQTGQDYAALLMGDVTGNWTPPTPLAERNQAKSESDSNVVSNAVRVSLPMLNAATNQNVTVPVSVGDVTGKGFLAYDLEVAFDPSVLQLEAATPVNSAGTVSSQMSLAANPNVTGRLIVAAYGVNYLQGAGTLLNLRFRVIGQSGQTSPLTFRRLVFNENPANSVTQNGQITVQSATSASVVVGGRITAANGYGIRNVIVTMTDAQGNRRIARSSSFGYFQFTDVPLGDNYVFTVASKRFIFSQPSQTRNVNQAIEDINFVADN